MFEALFLFLQYLRPRFIHINYIQKYDGGRVESQNVEKFEILYTKVGIYKLCNYLTSYHGFEKKCKFIFLFYVLITVIYSN